MTYRLPVNTHTAIRRSGWAALTLALLLGAGCGGDKKAPEPTAAPAAPTTTKAKLEKSELKFGFIKLTDMVPLAIAYEKGYSRTRASTSRWKHRPTGRCCWIA